MGQYTNLNGEQVKKRVEELIAQYAEHGIIEGSIWTVKQATKNGHTDVVEYLREMGV